MNTRRAPKKLWVDVTMLLAWKGKPTGIPRATASIVREWLALPRLNLGLCHFNAEMTDFQEISPESFQAHLAANEAAASEALDGGQPAAPAEPRPSLARRILGRTKRLASGLPGPAKLPLKWGWRGLKAARGLARAGVRTIRQRGKPRVAPVTLGPDDVLVSLGASWGVPQYHRTVWARKQREGFGFFELVHDLIACKFPQFFLPTFPPHFEGWLADLLWAADLVGADSECTRRDVEWFIRQTGCPRRPVQVIRLGDNVPAGLEEPGRVPVRGPFVLAVGTVEVRKNHLLLYHVWRRLVEEHGVEVPPLVIVGRPGWLSQDLVYQLDNDPLVQGRIFLVRETSDAELAWLYRNCLFTMYPSHYEGWGLPVAESLAAGKYCIASSASSVPEIGGDLVDYHEPVDLLACYRLTVRALFDAAFRGEREARIRRLYRPTSWSQTADGLLTLLERHFGPLRGEEEYREAVA